MSRHLPTQLAVWRGTAPYQSECRGRSPRPSGRRGVERELHAEVDTTGRSSDRRGDLGSVYGDWDVVAEDASAAAKAINTPRGGATRLGDIANALALASARPAALLEPEHEDYALALITAEGGDLEALCQLADDVRRDAVGDVVTYVVNRNINFTNVCYVGCRFCAFAQRKTDPDAYSLSLEEVALRVKEAVLTERPRSVCKVALTLISPPPGTSSSREPSRQPLRTCTSTRSAPWKS